MADTLCPRLFARDTDYSYIVSKLHISAQRSRLTEALPRRWQEFPGRGYDSSDRQFFVGDSLLVTPVLVPNVSSVMGVFPAAGGPWRDFWTHEELDVQPDVNSTIPAPLRSEALTILQLLNYS